jgi:beta-glucosidase
VLRRRGSRCSRSGYGLSRTTFADRNLAVKKSAAGASLSFTLWNTGKRAGAEVSEVYVGFPGTAGESCRSSRRRTGRCSCQPDESAQVTFTLDPRSYACWDTATNRWVVSDGAYTVLVGRSFPELPSQAQVKLGGTALGP